MPTPDVEIEEVLYRQIGPGGTPIYFDPNRSPQLHQAAFLPSSQDLDGLSLIRSRFRDEIWAAYRAEKPAIQFRLAKVPVAVLRELDSEIGFEGGGYVASPDGLDERFGEPWAHCVATHINRATYDVNRDAKVRIKEWALAVANGIGADSVRGPFAQPDESVPYRPQDVSS
jgi:hypothetical protein